MANGGTSREKTRRNVHASIDIEELVTSMRGKLDNLSLLSPEWCICEVPKRLRKINEEDYTPLKVSIGPLHHGKEGLEPMEEHKWRYLQDFLQRSQKILGEFVKFIGEREERIRQCYAETISFRRDKFVEIILVDAAFIIEVLLRIWFPYLRTANDPIFQKRMIFDVIRDMRLLENQLPYFVLKDLFEMANVKVGINQDRAPTFIELTYKYLQNSVQLGDIQDKIGSSQKHFIDLLRNCLVPRESSQQTERKKVVQFRHCATDLHEAGVKFEAGSSGNLFDMKFNGEGVLEIPYIMITDETECLLRNLLAFEHCHYGVSYITDYVRAMDCLINTSKDVELLVQSRVIENWLGESKDVSNLFNKLGKEIFIDNKGFYFSELFSELNDYCESPWHKWKATLRHDYFKTPWRVLSIVVAFIILLLTFIQAVCSIISVAK